MSFIFGLIVGGLFGVVLERLVGHPIDYFIIQPLLGVKRRRRFQRAAESVNLQNELCVVAGTALFVHHFVPAGFAWDKLHTSMDNKSLTLNERLEKSKFSSVLPDADQLERSIDSHAARLDADEHYWNGISLALSECQFSREPGFEQAELSLKFREENYATACAIEEAWESLTLEQRRSIDGNSLRRVDPLLCNGFGLNCTIETADGFVLLTHRSDYTRGWKRHRHISFNEGLSVRDLLPGGVVDLERGFARGLHEELGIQASQIPDFRRRLVVHTFVLDVDRYQWGLLAHLNLEETDITSAAIRMARNLGAATDDWEASDISFIPFKDSATEVISELINPNSWVSHGLLNLALSAIHRHPTKARQIRSALLGN